MYCVPDLLTINFFKFCLNSWSTVFGHDCEAQLIFQHKLFGVMIFQTQLKKLLHWHNITDGQWPWCQERLKVGEEGGNRGWDVWMASSTWWTWVWVSSGVSDGPGSLVCCSLWGCKESDTTEQLNWTDWTGDNSSLAANQTF